MSLLTSLPSITDKKSKRVGRGGGSGKGFHTAGKGNKGQKARRGGKIPVWFEGGQLPLIKRVPMLRGKGRLKNLKKTAEITFNDIEKMDTDTISLETLKLNKIIESKYKKAKIINTGELTKKITVQGLAVTKGARAVIEENGGTIEE